ncbi:FAD-binding domain-containing protein [Cadophora sp. DSE1049]|nr:FAD-binding domain-containing protein [Cadophora sp. DSE1049]
MQCCAEIAAKTHVTIQSWPISQFSADYANAKSHYWSNANADGMPACVVFPTSAQDVSSIIQVLLRYSDVGFATKSGGHNPNVGFASTDGGVLISMSQLSSTTLSPDRKEAYLSPGATWMDAVGALEPYNLTVVGGRVGDVGVGGLLVGCGLSFLSAQYGLPCDNINSYEIVLSNSVIVNADANENPDLFWAMKGGGNQFGIVTKFTVNTVPIGLVSVWGGVRTYTRDVAPQILAATQNFTENFPDPRAAIIMTFQTLVNSLDQFFAIFFFYNGPILPPGVFDAFNVIPSTGDSVKTQSYSSLLIANAKFGSIYGLRYVLRGATIPNLPAPKGTDLVIANFNNFVSYATSRGLAGLLQPGFIFNFIYQPVTVAIPAASARVNPLGNILGLAPDNGDHMWMAVTVSWLTKLGDTDAYRIATEIMDNVVKYTKQTYPGVKGSNFKTGLPDDGYQPPIFMNDAMADQKVLQGYGNETYARLKSIQKAYDPIGFFPSRTGGFKLI